MPAAPPPTSPLRAAAQSVFKEVDLDHDGKLDHVELANAIRTVYTKQGMSWINKYADRIKSEVD